MKKKEQLSANNLKRGIKGWQVALIGTGGVVGSCYFLGISSIFRDMGPASLIAFAIVAVVVYGMMLAYSDLLVNYPCNGSFVTYSKVFLGETAAACVGWSYWFDWICYGPSEAIAAAVVINRFFPGNQAAYAFGVLALLTIINLSVVDIFARIESTLAIFKLCIMSLFCLLGLGIWIGLWGSDGFLGASVNFGADLIGGLFPNGIFVVITNMVVVLANFQGVEILGLAAQETSNAKNAVPKACKTATWLSMCMYILPLIIITLLFPASLSSSEDTIFAQVLSHYHMDFWAALLSGAVLLASFSCANTGIYGSARCLFGLSQEGLAPKVFGKIGKNGGPRNAVIVTLSAMWLVLMLAVFSGETALFDKLLNICGFAGSLSWIGIISSQISFHRRLRKHGYSTDEIALSIPKRQRWMPVFALVFQLVCLFLMVFSAERRVLFIVSCAAVSIPPITFAILKKARKIPDSISKHPDFNVLYPSKANKA